MYKYKSESSTKSGHSTDASYGFFRENKQLDNRGLGSCYSLDQLNLLDEEVNFLCASDINGNAKVTGEKYLIEEYYACHCKKDVTCLDTSLKQPYSHAKSGEDSWLKEFESSMNDDLRKTTMRKDIEHFCLSNANVMMDLNSKQANKLSTDFDSDLIGLKNIEPWWHAADTHDLASLSFHTSSQLVGNSDLPEARTMHCVSVKGSSDSNTSFDQVREQTVHRGTKLSDLDSFTKGNVAPMTDSKDKSLGVVQLPDGILSNDSTTNKLDPLDIDSAVSGDLSRAELLEALCHSQTRAREAENMAQQACNEKDHVVNLFFRQASYLFAYRQWLRILQLETLCLQHRCKNQLSSFASPALPRKKRRVVKKRPGKPRNHVSKYVVAIALGMSLAGAGLLVGLAIGWIFPAF